MKAGYESVVKNHTYFERVATILENIGWEAEAKKCLEVKNKFFEVE